MTAHQPSVSAARTTHDIAIATLRLLESMSIQRGNQSDNRCQANADALAQEIVG